MAEKYGNIRESEGFKVVRYLQSGDPSEFYRAWNELGVYEIVWAGHGAKVKDGEHDGKYAGQLLGGDRIPFHAGESREVAHPNNVNPPYKLARVIGFSCGSACNLYNTTGIDADGSREGSWKDHVSEHGEFFGFTGSVWWFNIIFSSHAE